MHTLTIADHIIFGLLAFVLPLIAIFKTRKDVVRIPQDSRIKIRLYWLNSLILWAGALVIYGLWNFYDRDFGTLGVQWPIAESFPTWMHQH